MSLAFLQNTFPFVCIIVTIFSFTIFTLIAQTKEGRNKYYLKSDIFFTLNKYEVTMDL